MLVHGATTFSFALLQGGRPVEISFDVDSQDIGAGLIHAEEMPIPTLIPTDGLVLTRSARLKPGVYSLPSANFGKPALTVRGDHITVDLSGVVLRGSAPDAPPDQRRGVAILVDGGRDVTIKNAGVHGYRLAVLARNTVGLKLQGCDWSYNWKQHLKSTPLAENDADWMFFQQNDHDEWVNGDPGYGCGGAYLTRCSKFRVDHCSDTGSQCGLMMSRCDHGTVIDNDFSFLSAIGIGLYRSSDNWIVRNALDYCVRGYSHGVYSRGEDSASILVYEQSCRNAFINNSATRGGDGFFLWAGQSTLDTGKDGCNDNFVAGNDFSHSPANGIEATFSRNFFLGNRMAECWHGVWGGFSYDSTWIGNTFQYDGQAFAIEHGQNNSITANNVEDCDEGAVIWMVPNRKPDIGYMKVRDTRSRDYAIQGNRFSYCVSAAISLSETTGSRVENNKFDKCPVQVVEKSGGKLTVDGKEVESAPVPPRPTFMLRNGNNNPASEPMAFDGSWQFERANGYIEKRPYDFPGAAEPVHLLPSPAYRHLRGPGEWGRDHIIVDEWGPYDYRSPRLVGVGSDPGTLSFAVFGPTGRWRVVSVSGGTVTGTASGEVSNRFAPTLRLALGPGGTRAVRIECEFVGDRVVTPFGRMIQPGAASRFEWSGS